MAGYSAKINNPAFSKYILNTSRWSAIFSVFLALIAIVGFFIYGETSQEMENPQALLIGVAVGAMFMMVALYQIISRNKDKTWDGVIQDKKIEKKQRKQNSSNNDYYIHYYTEYKVLIEDSEGKVHGIVNEDDDTIYNYFQIGDRVRHHKGLNSYEKYDKSNDTIIFCNACGSINDIEDDYCFRCNCPLLK
ncbi:MAG: uncharacterized protein K0Q47_705 [Sedimentibacter sp.]|jgi:hypothetical protein|nr:uncharacterized protein [Sedimentibacter sp.]